MLQTEPKKAIKTIINFEKQLMQTEQKKAFTWICIFGNIPNILNYVNDQVFKT